MDDLIRVDVNLDLDERVGELVAKGGHLDGIADAIAERAREMAPEETGAYKAGIIVQETKHGARVVATDFKSAWIEFGDPPANQPARFILRNAVVSLGLHFKKSGH